MKTVTSTIRSLSGVDGPFEDVRAGWCAFLNDLKSRDGEDLIDLDPVGTLLCAHVYVSRNSPDLSCPRHPKVSKWFLAFACRPDVTAAFERFLKRRGLPLDGYGL